MKKCRLNYCNREYEINAGTLLSEFILKNGINSEMPCGGTGLCGKCRVKFLYGATRITAADRKHLTEKELEEGVRLACRAIITEDAGFIMLSGKKEEGILFSGIEEKEVPSGEADVALDIGTTTIAAAFLQKGKDGKNDVVLKRTIMNHQRMLGADVISRIQAANSGKGEELRRFVSDDIKRLTEGFLVKRLIIAGNTTMLHILTGDSCEGLGRAPYTPKRLSYPDYSLRDLLIEELVSNTKCEIFSGISAFVGADIVSGMYSLSFDSIPEGKRYMLIDLGTNGEMALADSTRISVCSTAAGPVFEGGGISCGMPGVKGAIEHITLNKRDIIRELSVIGDDEPVGICGSGVLELVSELKRVDLIDDTGLLKDQFFDKGVPLYSRNESGGSEKDIFFTQDDIRAVQLAKAAIRSGIDTLLKSHGCGPGDIDEVYLAGGFSEHLDMEKVKYLSIVPKEFIDKGICRCVGNTSLKGCEMALSDCDYREKMNSILKKSTEVKLAETDMFGEAFLKAMNFEE
ncbi:ASKHA domain-containing protein [Butyrivibrio sp. JL13D10]|uniref:ASKHA domain-containing protein n=1 Tax=Butyrivibrio sp. JL13D10 TaxID=3236815 RepID=UPI0038B627A9